MSGMEMKRLASAEDVRRYILRHRIRLARRRPPKGVALMRAYTDLMDEALLSLFHLAAAGAGRPNCEDEGNAPGGVCLIATGGYGRRELSPFSDIDVAFIVENEDDPRVDALVKSAYRLLTDALLNDTGLKVGYSYRLLADVRDMPLDTHTALLDGRYIAGDSTLSERFRATVRQAVSPAAFVIGHANQRRAAKDRFGDSPYRLEPDLKEGVGGLRDIHAMRWMTRIAFNCARGEELNTLRASGVISDREINSIVNALEFISRVRNALHFVSGLPRNVLSIDAQEEVAGLLGMKSGASEMMERHFVHAACVHSVYRKAADACLDTPLTIEPGMVYSRGALEISDRGILLRDPHALIRIFEKALALDARVGASASELIRERVDFRPSRSRRHRIGSGCSGEFLRILSLPGVDRALRAMADLGVLQWLIPEFRRLLLSIPRDVAHELTIGAHSLEAVRQLCSLNDSDDPELRDVFANIREQEVLVLATLLHDVGKLTPGEPHERSGATMARRIGERLGLGRESADTLEFLVRNHLLMASTARVRDLTEKKTIESFTAVVNSLDLLDMMYLLTVADLRAVGQANWSEAQVRFVRELYHRASVLLRMSGQPEMDLERHRGRLARELSLQNLPEDEVREHCVSMPASYLLNTSPDDLASHILYVREAAQGSPVVRFRDDPANRLTEIVVCTRDDPSPGLLAKITGVLCALDVDIHAARVYTRASEPRLAIDLLYVDAERRCLSDVKKLQVQTELEAVLAGKAGVDELLMRFGKRFCSGIRPTHLEIVSHASDRHSVVEVESEDRLGLLHRLTKAMSVLGWNIHSARVNTWGNRAMDAFYVTDGCGRKLGQGAREALEHALQEPSS